MSTLLFSAQVNDMTIQTENGSYDQGREAQYREMMQQLAQLQQKYKGVRGELLAKVRDELMRLKPGTVAPAPTQTPSEEPASPAKAARPTPPDQMLPSCRVCGRGMKLNEAEKGTLICARGHTRLMT